MSKYYTPDISEFYDNFEYEIEVKTGKWERRIFDIWEAPHILNQYNYRVKYLDEQDIKDLGWSAKGWGFEKDSVRLRKMDNQWLITDYREKADCPPHILLTIKNKSELKKLMKMLGNG